MFAERTFSYPLGYIYTTFDAFWGYFHTILSYPYICDTAHTNPLQLSMFVDYTWQCMKLPDQPSSSSSSSFSSSVTKMAPSTVTSVVSDCSDVTIAAADSTTHGTCTYYTHETYTRNAEGLCEGWSPSSSHC